MSFILLSLSFFLSVKSFLLTSIFSRLEKSLSCNQQNKQSWKYEFFAMRLTLIGEWPSLLACWVFFMFMSVADLTTNGKICSIDSGCKEGLDLGLQKNCTNNAPSLGLVLHVLATC